MSENINKWIGTGTLTRDSEQSYTQSGYAMLKFSIASNSRRKQGEQWVDEAGFFDCILWGKRGESLAQYMLKGKQVAIDGKLKQDRWQDKESGKNRSKIVINIDNIQLIGGKNDSHSNTANGTVQNNVTNDDMPETDRIPF